jgi:hypothetical protein
VRAECRRTTSWDWGRFSDRQLLARIGCGAPDESSATCCPSARPQEGQRSARGKDRSLTKCDGVCGVCAFAASVDRARVLLISNLQPSACLTATSRVAAISLNIENADQHIALELSRHYLIHNGASDQQSQSRVHANPTLWGENLPCTPTSTRNPVALSPQPWPWAGQVVQTVKYTYTYGYT